MKLEDTVSWCSIRPHISRETRHVNYKRDLGTTYILTRKKSSTTTIV